MLQMAVIALSPSSSATDNLKLHDPAQALKGGLPPLTRGKNNESFYKSANTRQVSEYALVMPSNDEQNAIAQCKLARYGHASLCALSSQK